MPEQTLTNKIGNAIGECKKRMFDRLKQGQDLELAIDQFMVELRLAFNVIEAENLNPASVTDSK